MRALGVAGFWVARLDPTSAELALAVSALVFGAALLLPVDLSVRSPAFRALVDLLPQPAWAILWLAFGAAQLVGAVTGYRRQGADVAAACLWSSWTLIQIVHLGPTIGPFTYGWLALASIVASHLEQRRGGA